MSYHNLPSISPSDLAGKSTPAEFYQQKHINKQIQRDYFDIGTACHAYILEPEAFKNDIVVFSDFPEPDKINKDGTVSKVGKNGQAYDAFKLLHPDKIVFEQAIFDNVVSYAESIKRIPKFDQFINLETGVTERPFFTVDPETGLELRMKPDYVKEGKFFADLKFPASIDERDIAKMFYLYEYHLKAAFYMDFYDVKAPQFIFIIVSKTDTPAVRFIKLSDFDLNAGRELYRQRLNTIARCYKTNEWIAESIENYQLPEWVYNKSNTF